MCNWFAAVGKFLINRVTCGKAYKDGSKNPGFFWAKEHSRIYTVKMTNSNHHPVEIDVISQIARRALGAENFSEKQNKHLEEQMKTMEETFKKNGIRVLKQDGTTAYGCYDPSLFIHIIDKGNIAKISCKFQKESGSLALQDYVFSLGQEAL